MKAVFPQYAGKALQLGALAGAVQAFERNEFSPPAHAQMISARFRATWSLKKQH
jgi:hypothetical protein